MFHLTHRCHNRAFLLKFARDREAYRTLVREHLRAFEVVLLDYCVTSNHVHMLASGNLRRRGGDCRSLIESWKGEESRKYEISKT